MGAVNKQGHNTQSKYYPIYETWKRFTVVQTPTDNNEEDAEQTAADIKEKIEKVFDKFHHLVHKNKIPLLWYFVNLLRGQRPKKSREESKY